MWCQLFWLSVYRCWCRLWFAPKTLLRLVTGRKPCRWSLVACWRSSASKQRRAARSRQPVFLHTVVNRWLNQRVRCQQQGGGERKQASTEQRTPTQPPSEKRKTAPSSPSGNISTGGRHSFTDSQSRTCVCVQCEAASPLPLSALSPWRVVCCSLGVCVRGMENDQPSQHRWAGANSGNVLTLTGIWGIILSQLRNPLT